MATTLFNFFDIMPNYTYVTGAGEKIVLNRTVADRDEHLKLERVFDASGQKVLTPDGNRDPQTDEVLKGYYKQEQKDGSRFKSSFSKKQIKEAWRR